MGSIVYQPIPVVSACSTRWGKTDTPLFGLSTKTFSILADICVCLDTAFLDGFHGYPNK